MCRNLLQKVELPNSLASVFSWGFFFTFDVNIHILKLVLICLFSVQQQLHNVLVAKSFQIIFAQETNGMKWVETSLQHQSLSKDYLESFFRNCLNWNIAQVRVFFEKITFKVIVKSFLHTSLQALQFHKSVHQFFREMLGIHKKICNKICI